MNRRLLTAAAAFACLPGCTGLRPQCCGYLTTPRPGVAPCATCDSNAMVRPPRHNPAGPAPGGLAAPLPPGAPIAPGAFVPPGPPAAVGPPAAEGPPAAVGPPPGPGVRLSAPEPAEPQPGPAAPAPPAPPSAPAAPPPSSSARLYPPQTDEPPKAPAAPPAAPAPAAPPQKQEPTPPAGDGRGATPSLPVEIPQFAIARPNVAAGLQPSPDGIPWLKAHGYRTVLHVRRPGEDDTAARRQFQTHNLNYLSLEVSPQTLSKAVVDEFNRLVTDRNNQPLFVYDADGSLAGGLWYLHFRLVEGASDEKARTDAAYLGFKQDQNGPHRNMWLAIQKFLESRKP